MHLLKPTSDLVFKLLLQRSRDLNLLRSMLQCILQPSSPLEHVEILNPDIEKDHPADKPIALDIRAELHNLTRIDIEMQASVVASSASRFLYYWSRLHGLGLKRGDDYAQLVPVTSIIWLGENLLKAQQFHSVFHVSEDTTHERFSKELEIHTLELQKLQLLSPNKNLKLYRWSRFLVADSEEEFDRLALEDADMANAKKTLEELSADKKVREQAYERETALRAYHHTIASERAEGEARGEARGIEKGLRASLTLQLTKRFGVLPDWASERVAHASTAQLESYLDSILTAASLEETLKLNA